MEPLIKAVKSAMPPNVRVRRITSFPIQKPAGNYAVPVQFRVSLYEPENHFEATITLAKPKSGELYCTVTHSMPHASYSKLLNVAMYEMLQSLPTWSRRDLAVMTPEVMGTDAALAVAQPGLEELCKTYGGQQTRPNTWSVKVEEKR